MASMVREDQAEQTNVELWGIYNVLRNSYLNVLYYERMASRWSNWNLWLQIGASFGSLGAVGTFVAVGTGLFQQQADYWKLAAAIIGVLSALCGAVPAVAGITDKAKRFERLYFAYSELFQIAQRTVMDVRREGVMTPELVGSAKMLHDLCSRLGQLDEPGVDDKLKAKCEGEVRTKYAQGLWYASGNGNQEPAGTEAR